MEHIPAILPRREVPSKQNHYLRAERPLSYQPHFTPVTTQPVNNYGYPEPGIQVCCFIICREIIKPYLHFNYRAPPLARLSPRIS